MEQPLVVVLEEEQLLVLEEVPCQLAPLLPRRACARSLPKPAKEGSRVGLWWGSGWEERGQKTHLKKAVFHVIIVFGIFPLFLNFAITAFGGPEGYFSLAIKASGVPEFHCPQIRLPLFSESAKCRFSKCHFSKCRFSVGIIEREVPQAFVWARASSATLCSVHVFWVFLCNFSLCQKGNLTRNKTGLDTYLMRIQTCTPLSRYPPS